MTAATFSCFIDALDFFFSDAGDLLANSSLLVHPFLAEQPPQHTLRLESELPRYGQIQEDNHRYFGELLEPCETSLESC
jgi:hypothetical protein